MNLVFFFPQIFIFCPAAKDLFHFSSWPMNISVQLNNWTTRFLCTCSNECLFRAYIDTSICQWNSHTCPPHGWVLLTHSPYQGHRLRFTWQAQCFTLFMFYSSTALPLLLIWSSQCSGKDHFEIDQERTRECMWFGQKTYFFFFFFWVVQKN